VEHDPSKTWGEYLPQVLCKYNFNDIHSAIGKTPEQATRKHNQLDVHMQLLGHKRMDRRSEPLNVGDKVEIYLKVKFKSNRPAWSDNSYTISAIEQSHNQKVYKLEGQQQLYLRHELLLVPKKEE